MVLEKENISWTDRVRNEEVLHRVIEERNVLLTVKSRKANWIGNVLRRNCLLKYVSEGKIKEWIKVTGRRGIRRTELQDYLKETRRYWKLKEEAVDRTVWRTGFGKSCGLALGEAVDWLWERLWTGFGRCCGLALGEAVD